MAETEFACVKCGSTEEPSGGGRETCMRCWVQAIRESPLRGLTLDDKVEAHRQEKELRKLVRAELKKRAKKRAAERRHRIKVAARKRLEPQVQEGEVDVDPATKELAQRELSRRRLIEFIQEFHPRYKAGWVHRDICARLEKFAKDVADGKSPRLMILMPPRHGKSQIASKMFPAWMLGHFNWFEVIACSYNVSLALEFSREVRSIVKSDRYGVLFPSSKLDPDVGAAEAWKLQSPTGVGAGGYVAAGIGGPITGKGAHVLIIDDPIKNAEEADSPEQRKKIWDWYGSTAYTRLAPGGGVLVIQTCWHDDDLAGHLQAEMKAAQEAEDKEVDQFEVVKYPALAIEEETYRGIGEALHPERYDEAALARIKRTIGPRYWAALYQQDPVPDEGAYFTKTMIVDRVGGLELSRCHIIQGWDFALGDKKTNDWNVGVTLAQDYNDNLHVVEVVRFRTKDLARTVREMLNMYGRYQNVMRVAVEDGKEWRGMQPLLAKAMAEARQYPTFGEPMQALTDKAARARPLQGRMEHGKVTIPPNAPWKEGLVKELMRFPTGMHDDQVDALAWAVHAALLVAPPKPPRPQRQKGEKTLQERLKELARGPTGGSHMAS